MPVKVRKSGNAYRVTDAGRVTARATTKAKAQKQARLLRALDHGFKPTKRR